MSDQTPVDSQSTPNKLQSLMDISRTSDNTSNADKPIRNQEQIQRIVLQTLEQLQPKLKFGDVNTLTSLIVPKVLYDLQSYDKLVEEVENIKESLNSSVQHSKVVSEDIAEIYLDLHNIYSKLEKFEKCQKLKDETSKKFQKRIVEANKFLKSTKHYITNDNCSGAGTSGTSQSKSTPNVSSLSQTEDTVSSTDTLKAEKRAFISNMIMAKKSDFSLNLNRHKQFYTAAEKVLNSKTTKE